MKSRSIVTRALMTGVASLAFVVTSVMEVRAEIVTVQGANGADAIDGDPDVPSTGGKSATATAGSTQPVTDASNSAFATGGNGGNGGSDLFNNPGSPGGAATATAATTVTFGSAEADAKATGGNGGNYGPGVGTSSNGNGGYASASSTARTSGSGDAWSSADATGGATGTGDYGFAGAADAAAVAAAEGGGKATAAAVATGGICNTACGTILNSANATSTAETVNGATASALSTATSGNSGGSILPPQGQASSTAKTSFAGASVKSTATALIGNPSPYSDGVVASTNAIAEGGSGQAFVNPGRTAYAFSTAHPDKAYAASLIDDASHVASALLGPNDMVLGTAILGANNVSDSVGGTNQYSVSSTFDFGYGGDLMLGLIDDQVSGFADGQGFQSMEFTTMADGAEILDRTFTSLAVAESFFHDDIIDLGSDFGPNIDLTFGYTLVADGSGGFGFDFAIGGPVPEPTTWAMMLAGFAGLGFAGYRSTRRSAAAGLQA